MCGKFAMAMCFLNSARSPDKAVAPDDIEDAHGHGKIATHLTACDHSAHTIASGTSDLMTSDQTECSQLMTVCS